MTSLVSRFKARYGNRDRGTSAVEYALILVLVTGVLVLLFATIGNDVRFRLNQTCVAIGACK